MNERKMDRRAFMGGAVAALVGTSFIGRPSRATELAGLQGVDRMLKRPTPRLLVDRMLVRPARWLRAAGYDAAIPAPTARNVDLVRQAETEGRLIVSTSRKLAELHAEPRRLVLLAEQRLPAAAAELTTRLGVDWLHDPFTRCLRCNLPVEVADPAVWWPAPAADRAPLAAVLPLTRCAACDQLYWKGGHVGRMQARLEAWAEGRFV